MGSKTLTLTNLKFASLDDGVKSRARKVKKRTERSPVKWLGKEWKSRMARFFPGTKVEWTGVEGSLVKKLIDENGYNRTLSMIDHFFDTWNRRKASRSGTPGIRFFWAIRGTLLAEMDGLAKIPELRETKIASGEFSEESAKASPTQGWGDVEEDTDPYKGCGNGW